MTAKQFFKSTAFKSLAVLIAIVLIAGTLLAICNDLLHISDEERFARSIERIYGKAVETVEISLSEEQKTYESGTVNSVYYVVDDGNYLLQTTGNDGYDGGSITLWTVLTCSGERDNGTLALTGIDRVVYESNEKQSAISSLTNAYYAGFAEHDDLVAAGGMFTADKYGSGDLNHLVAGATRSSNAACNAVNTALACFRTALTGGDA